MAEEMFGLREVFLAVQNAGELNHQARVARVEDEAGLERGLRFVPALKLGKREAAIELEIGRLIGRFGDGIDDGVVSMGVVERFDLSDFIRIGGRRRLGRNAAWQD
ncbi:MAG: hypothetical protein KGL75_00735, partial [Acidobacteriota bacterium]|nr:hypothetical protein [Acidobacteriota bacterium]